MIHSFSRDQNEILIDNLIHLQNDVRAIHEEEHLFLQTYFSSVMTPEMTFDRAVKQILGGYKRLVTAQSNITPEACAKTKAILCQTLAKHFSRVSVLSKLGALPFLVQKTNSFATLSFWKTNPISSVGFERFSSLFQSTTPVFSESFAEACEHIVTQTSDFGILPIENSVDGALSVFYKMMDKYDLKICAICDVDDAETEMTTRLALVTKNLCAFEGCFPRYIEFSRVVSDEETQNELFYVAKVMGTRLRRLLSLPLSYRTNANVETLRFALEEENVVPFLIYLHIFCADINTLGFFVQI